LFDGFRVFANDQQQKSMAVDEFFGLLPINFLNTMDFYVIHGRNPVPGEFFGNPIKNGSLSMSTGAGFLSSTVFPCFQESRIDRRDVILDLILDKTHPTNNLRVYDLNVP